MTHQRTSSLVKKALESPRTKPTVATYGPEQALLALAWARDEVGGQQVLSAIGKRDKQQGSLYNFLAMALRYAVVSGLLVERNGKAKP